MRQMNDNVPAVTRGILARRLADRRWAGRLRGRLPGLSLVGIFLMAGPGTAQVPDSLGHRLTVRPRQMPLTAQTTAAGEFPLESAWDYIAYVPPLCVGTRCPLVTF